MREAKEGSQGRKEGRKKGWNERGKEGSQASKEAKQVRKPRQTGKK